MEEIILFFKRYEKNIMVVNKKESFKLDNICIFLIFLVFFFLV